ncbi:G-type lectin S-receptor-like serine/threonine-protein kinase B120 isoform E [Glycine soja]|uniref:G-type lectin S-receptor-like serine/threonine-protein kinase B120 isoform E n=1 Tax=Glycine soja TaxID=3848 RepID=A0A445GWM6_GLYSO|nr:G-type lectin S-receptor-like serine/threonine-protein kinase B120 isoform E [Glycine soja]
MCLQRPGIFKFAAEFEGGAYRSCEKLVIRFGITLLTSVLTKNHTLIPWQTNLLQISFSIFEAAGYEAYGTETPSFRVPLVVVEYLYSC